jgi:hypothetical protein
MWRILTGVCHPSISHLYIYLVDESLTKRGRGRLRKTIRETIRKDLEVNELDPNMFYNRTLWRNLIYVADPT